MEDGIKNILVCLLSVVCLSEYSGSRIRFQYPNPSHTVEHPLKHNTCSYKQSRTAAFNKYFRVLTNTYSYVSHASNAYSLDCNESTGVFKTRNKRKPTNRRRVREGGTAKYVTNIREERRFLKWQRRGHLQQIYEYLASILDSSLGQEFLLTKTHNA